MSDPVEAAREVLLNGVAAFDFDAYEAALDAYAAAIRAESAGTGLDFAQLDAFTRLEEAIEGERRSWIRVEVAPDDLALLLQFAYARLSSSDTER